MTRILSITGLALIVAATTVASQLPRTKSPEGARAYIISPRTGATVGQTFTVQFGLKGMGVAPAGVNTPNTGHHHLLVDLPKPPDMTMPLPVNDNIRHFGGGQTEVDLKLAPGKHTLQLLLGDHLHTPHEKPVMSEVVTVTVK
jgi:hypothetical protein